MLAGPSILSGDCKSVVESARLPDMCGTHCRRMHAGTRRLAILSNKLPLVMFDRHVRAHRADSAAVDSND
eukprot:7075413-Karenia_brevis.AAC.1